MTLSRTVVSTLSLTALMTLSLTAVGTLSLTAVSTMSLTIVNTMSLTDVSTMSLTDVMPGSEEEFESEEGMGERERGRLEELRGELEDRLRWGFSDISGPGLCPVSSLNTSAQCILPWPGRRGREGGRLGKGSLANRGSRRKSGSRCMMDLVFSVHWEVWSVQCVDCRL